VGEWSVKGPRGPCAGESGTILCVSNGRAIESRLPVRNADRDPVPFTDGGLVPATARGPRRLARMRLFRTRRVPERAGPRRLDRTAITQFDRDSALDTLLTAGAQAGCAWRLNRYKRLCRVGAEVGSPAVHPWPNEVPRRRNAPSYGSRRVAIPSISVRLDRGPPSAAWLTAFESPNMMDVA
jgi:hypothetical protein